MAKRTRISDFTDDDRKSIHDVARNIAFMRGFTFSDLDDIKQELSLGLFMESDKYRSRLSDWKTFRWKVLERIGGKIIRRKHQPSSRFMKNPALSLNEEGTCDDFCPDDHPTVMDCVTQDGLLADGTEKDGSDEIGLRIDIQVFIETLPSNLRDLCIALMERDAYGAAKKLGVSKSLVYARIAIIREKMIAAGLDAYLPNREKSPRKGEIHFSSAH